MGRVRKVIAKGPVLSPVGERKTEAGRLCSPSACLNGPIALKRAGQRRTFSWRTSPPAQAALPSFLITMIESAMSWSRDLEQRTSVQSTRQLEQKVHETYISWKMTLVSGSYYCEWEYFRISTQNDLAGFFFFFPSKRPIVCFILFIPDSQLQASFNPTYSLNNFEGVCAIKQYTSYFVLFIIET